MISTVISIYNPNEFLEKQLDSIRNQSCPVDEVILVDDASSNDAPERIESYIEKHHLKNWKFFRSEQNLGFVNSFRKALCLAGGDLIILSDQDDIWKISKVETIKKEFENHPEMLALATSFDEIDENDVLIEVKDQKGKANHNILRKAVEKGSLNRLSYPDIAIYSCAPGCTSAIRSSLKDLYLGWQGNLPHDWSLFAIAALNGGLYYLDLPTTLYRQHSSNTYGLKHLSQLDERRKRARQDLEQKEALKDLVYAFSDDPRARKTADEAARLFKARLDYLSSRKMIKALGVLRQSLSFPFLYETIGADIKAMLKPGKDESDQQPESNAQEKR